MPSAPSKKITRTFSRPGVAASVRLATTLLHDPSSVWQTIERRYGDMLDYKGGARLVALERSCQTLRAKLLAARATPPGGDGAAAPCVTAKELFEVVEWKFAKGKPRHALWGHLRSNADAAVVSRSRIAFAKVRHPSVCETDEHDGDDDDDDDIRGALVELTKLKGVGPATASAILSLYRPDLFCFMDDEVIECLYPKPRGYTLKIYLEVNAECRALARKLGATTGERWTGRRVGKALWTAALLCAKGGDGEDLTVDGSEAVGEEGGGGGTAGERDGDRPAAAPRGKKRAAAPTEKPTADATEERTDKKRRHGLRRSARLRP